MQSDSNEGAPPERITLLPQKWVQNGFTLAHDSEGRPVFIHGALPGEEVEVEIDRTRSTHRFARTLSVVKPGALRVPSDCSAFPACGGCSFRHIPYEEEARLKWELLGEHPNLRRMRDDGNLTFHRSPPDGYRTAVRLHAHAGALGLYAPHSRTVVPLPETGCRQLSPQLNAAVRSTTPASPELDGDMRFSEHSEGVAREADHKAGNLVTIVAGDLRWRFPAGVFFQSNGPLLGTWLEFLHSLIPKGQPDVVELFCGTGIISGFCRDRLGSVRGYDSDPRSLAAARQNFKECSYEGRFARLDLYGWPVSLPDTPLLICNPPRAGLKKGTALSLGRLKKLKTILYSSCNTATLDRDIQRLSTLGFVGTVGAVFDFFPRTPHTETVVLLQREVT